MILQVQHETRFEYSEPATEWMTEVRMEPVSSADQSCHSFHLSVTPTTEIFRYLDGFGNRVHHFNLPAVAGNVSIRAASVVETHPTPSEVRISPATYPLSLDNLPLDVFDFLGFRGPVRPTPLLTPLLEALRPHPGTPLASFVADTCRYVHTHFEYAPHVTLATSPIDDLLLHGKGVCQDFTHLMLAILRSFQVPARYVSGYVHRPDKESQSHAWCQVWLPESGWFGLDPTNDRSVDDHFVTVAVGRDFFDVPPNKGVYRGPGRESMFVRVETRELQRLPAFSWQDQLPPLSVPLTAIVARVPAGESFGETGQQQ